MMGLAVVWVVVSLLAAGFALQYLFSINIERSTREDMDAALKRLAAVIIPSSGMPFLSSPLPDPRYSTPFGGRYWQIEALDTGQIARSRSLWDFVVNAPATDDAVYHQAGPDGRRAVHVQRSADFVGDCRQWDAVTHQLVVGRIQA